MKRRVLLAMSLGFCVIAGTGAIAGAEEEASPPGIQERLQELDQKVRVLERNRELDLDAAAERERTQPAAFAGKDGFGIRTPDGGFQIRFRGYVQADARNFLADRSSLSDQFLVRRAVGVVDATFHKKYDFRISPDFGAGKVQLLDAYVDARFHDALQLQAGKFKSPVGMEVLQSSADLLFVERSLTANLLPNYDVGLAVHGNAPAGSLAYSVGIFNGSPDGASTDVAAGDERTVAGRIVAAPFRGTEVDALHGLRIGIGGSYGKARTAAALGSYKSPAQEKIFAYRSGTGGDGVHYRIAPHGSWYYGRFGIYGEYVLSAQEVTTGAAREELENSAWQLAGSVMLTDDTASERGVSPKRGFDPAAGRWGAVQLAARISRLEIDADAFPVFADPAASVRSVTSCAAGINWYLNRNAKAQLNYEQSSFDVGKAEGGRRTERVLLTRLQLAF